MSGRTNSTDLAAMSRRTIHQLRVVAILLLVFAAGYLIAESSDVFTVFNGVAGR